MLQHRRDSIPQISREIIKNQVGEGLAYGVQFGFQIVAQNHVRQPEVNCRAHWQVGNYHSVRLSTVLVEQN